MTEQGTSGAFRVGADGTTEELFSYEEAIRQFVYIELPFDGDDDGRNDLIRADIIRPRELDGVAKVPVIMDPSPYYERLDRHNDQKKYLHPDDKWDSPLTVFPFFYDNYFVPRGYAVVMPDTSGTALSDGFCDIGGRRDIASCNAVVDWVNGRAKAYWTRDDRSEANRAYADWCTGAVAAIGKSYDGSLANGMAATGVEGLKTIVPISAISSQYDWYHPFGCLLDGDDADGGWYEPYNFAEYLQSTAHGKLQRFTTAPDGYKALKDGSDKERRSYNEPFWGERNYRAHAGEFKASVFLVHGVNDLNVMMNQVDRYWAALGEAGVPRKIWLHQYGHDDPFDVRHDAWVRTLNRWFDYWLLGVDNGIMDEPVASVEGSDGVWRDYASWPVPGAADHVWGVSGEGVLAEGASDAEGGDASGSGDEGSAAVAHFAAGRIKELTPLAQAFNPHEDRLLYVSAPLAADAHVSGTPRVRLRVRATAPDTNLTVQLIEYGEGNYVQVNPDLHAIVELKETRTCGQSSPDDKPTYPVCVPRRSTEVQHVVTRGWIATAHAAGFDAYAPTPVGEWFDVEIPMLATDWTVRAGHRIALQIANNTTRLAKVPESGFDVDLGALRLVLPVAR
ncbi:CocE/NonD family hydrolase [Bifidobacterium avesanii]|uniref:Xaa-Pro dipeptidyl-peptidase n=1 Tax=Bifidobacterium avesanii TaxID=1798157 RepID=A0A7K3TJG5_9BIFI|nr:CocE/NonD family hydrolase [Bifidobacterium avesanii]KAB8289900.1 X-Pro dipeptidyl-peptidase (S15 family) [Bifidobacterium avesanii]NEG78859.1 CocE/NonD family hydrolase [Bifidobacterium avesanii]